MRSHCPSGSKFESFGSSSGQRIKTAQIKEKVCLVRGNSRFTGDQGRAAVDNFRDIPLRLSLGHSGYAALTFEIHDALEMRGWVFGI
jgi:hypothetical protein